MLAFYREHDQEKRGAFNKLRDYFTIRAKMNREENQENKRQKTIDFMAYWDKKRVERDGLIEIYLNRQRQINMCKSWIVISALFERF